MTPPQVPVLFVGLGTMGLPMASNLLKAGFKVVGADMNEAALVAFAERGGTATIDAAGAAANADVVVSMLPDDAIVRAALGGAKGVISALRLGSLVVEISTTGPDTKI